MKQENLRLRVGIFVAIGLFVILVVILKFGRLTERMQNTYEIKAYFGSVSNISPGAPVRMSGVRIGRAESIELQRIEGGELKVRVGLRINQEHNIAIDTQLYLVSSGMLGESYFQFVPPSQREFGAPIEFYPKDGEATIPNGETKPGIEEATEGISLAAQQLNEIFGDEAFKENIRQIPQNATELTQKGSQAFAEIETFAKHLNAIVEQEDFRENITTLFQSSNQRMQELKALISRLSTVIDRIERGEGTVGKLVNDDALYNKATEAIDEVTKTASAFRRRPLSQIWSHGAQPAKDSVWETLFGKKENIREFDYRGLRPLKSTSEPEALPDLSTKPETEAPAVPSPVIEKMEEVVERAVQKGIKKGVEAAIKEKSTEPTPSPDTDPAGDSDPIEKESSEEKQDKE